MKKYLVLSFDDGTIYDRRFIELLNKYNIPATLNLNSGLGDFVWYYDNQFPIERLKLEECGNMFDGHEIASHTLTHPYLTSLSFDELIHQVNDDVNNLERIFNRKVESFGVPFTECNEREIDIIKNQTPIKYMRLSYTKDKYDFSIPHDKYHFGVNALYNDLDIYNQIKVFADNKLDKSIFIIAGHSYEFEVNNHWDYIENLLKYVKLFNEFEIVTFRDAVKNLFE
jgi:peptidoglycan/xylan/chitin deacetylase (PgdA/CDA1 family)